MVSTTSVATNYGPVASGNYLYTGTTEFVYAGGTALATTLYAGSLQFIYNGGAASGDVAF